MATTYPSRNLSISINRNVRDVYNFVCVSENFPRWVSGLSKSLKKVNGGWIAETPEGPVQIRFTERNEFGVLDHWVNTIDPARIYLKFPFGLRYRSPFTLRYLRANGLQTSSGRINKPGLHIYIPMRVIANGSGCEPIFTLFRLSGISDEKFNADAEWVLRDLASLKKLLEAA